MLQNYRQFGYFLRVFWDYENNFKKVAKKFGGYGSAHYLCPIVNEINKNHMAFKIEEEEFFSRGMRPHTAMCVTEKEIKIKDFLPYLVEAQKFNWPREICASLDEANAFKWILTQVLGFKLEKGQHPLADYGYMWEAENQGCKIWLMEGTRNFGRTIGKEEKVLILRCQPSALWRY